MDPDPLIRTLDFGYGSRIRLLIFLTGAFKMSNISFFIFFTVVTFTSVFKTNMSLRSYKTVEVMVYINFLLVVEAGSVQIITDLDPDPRGLKSLVRTHLGLCPGVTMVCAEKDHGYPSMQLFSFIQGINWNIQANSWQTCTHSCQHWNKNKCTKCIHFKLLIIFLEISCLFGMAETQSVQITIIRRQYLQDILYQCL